MLKQLSLQCNYLHAINLSTNWKHREADERQMGEGLEVVCGSK